MAAAIKAIKGDEKANVRRNGIHVAVKEVEARHEELLGIASNDLRNPLGVIIVASTVLAREMTETHHAEPLAAIRRAALEMTQVIEDLLDAASIDAGGLRLGREECEPRELVQEAVAAARTAATGRSCAVEASIEDDLPRIRVDRYRVLQVFSRFVANALRFTPKNGFITIGVARETDKVRFFVTDSGPTVPESQRSLAFLRCPPQGRRTCRGTGLGMFVGKGIVEAHGGHVELTSDAERGTTVSFTLPVWWPEDEEPV